MVKISSGLIQTIKQAAIDAYDAMKPCDYFFGTITKISPLEVKIDASLTLPEEVLDLSRNVTNYNIPITIDWNTETASEHIHQISGTKSIKVNNALKVGEKVILLRKQGGQRYLILDRIG